MATLNLQVTLPSGKTHYCFGVKSAAEVSKIKEKTLRYHLQQGKPYEKNGIKVEEIDKFPKLELNLDVPTRVILKGKIVKE